MKVSKSIKFSFYGFGIEIKCNDQETLDNIKRDYSFFINDQAPTNVSFEVFNEEPKYSELPCLKASFHTPRNICYKQDGISFIDYFGKGLTVIDKSLNTYKVYSAQYHLRHEIVFLSVLSLVGQHLDSKNIHRVHSLGLEVKNKAILVLLPSGGGKTTLLLDLIKNDLIKFMSEDSPLIDASGKVLPFPIRIGICPENKPQGVADEHLHLAERMEFEPKYLMDVHLFKDKIAGQPLEIGSILCGTRCLGPGSSIEPLSKYNTLKRMVKDCVIGIGLYQGIELIFQQSPFELLKKSGVLFSRLRNVSKAVSKARTYSFILGCDRKENIETFLDFCRKIV